MIKRPSPTISSDDEIMRKLANLIIDRIISDKKEEQLIKIMNPPKIRPWK